MVEQGDGVGQNRPTIEGQILLIDGGAHTAPHTGSRDENKDTHENNIQTLTGWTWLDASGGMVLLKVGRSSKPGCYPASISSLVEETLDLCDDFLFLGTGGQSHFFDQQLAGQLQHLFLAVGQFFVFFDLIQVAQHLGHFEQVA